MIYLKHPEHGYLAVPQIEETHTVHGWVECDIYKEIKPAKQKSIADMTKEELEAFARGKGVELDRRKSKANMLKDFEEALK